MIASCISAGSAEGGGFCDAGAAIYRHIVIVSNSSLVILSPAFCRSSRLKFNNKDLLAVFERFMAIYSHRARKQSANPWLAGALGIFAVVWFWPAITDIIKRLAAANLDDGRSCFVLVPNEFQAVHIFI